MKIILIGTVQFSNACLFKLIELKANIVGVVTKKESKFNSDFADLSPTALANEIPILLCENINKRENLDWVKRLEPDIIFCFGWSNLLGKEILELPKLGVLGFHPSALPLNRGRHPIIWAIALGLTKTASTFFLMDEGADTGDIVSQKEILIDSNDDAGMLYKKITDTALVQLEEILQSFIKGHIVRIKQNLGEGNTWRKRNKNDGLIDFRMSSTTINNLIRALSKPYLGAHILFNGNEFKVWTSFVVEFENINIEPGKVLNIKGNHILIKTSDAAIWIEEHEIPDSIKLNDYL
jgi:methionyl-tRNA formyltransferase